MLYEKQNPELADHSMLNITKHESGCCPETPTERAMYQAEVASFDGVDTLTFKGSDGEERTIKIDADTVEQLTEKLIDLSEKPYREGGLGAVMIGENYDGGGITVTEDSGTVKITILADFEIVSVSKDDTPTTFTKFADEISVIRQTIDLPVGAIGAVSAGGVDEALSTGTYAAGASAALKTDLETALGTLEVQFSDLEVTNEGNLHCVVVVASEKLTFTAVGDDLERVTSAGGSRFSTFVDANSDIVSTIETETR